jgi:hypothetical protein
MRQNRSESFLAHDIDDPLALNFFGPQTEHSRAGFAHEQVAQIGATSGQQERRIGEDSCHIGRVLRGEEAGYETDIHYAGVGPRRVHVRYTPDKDGSG